MGKVEGEYLEDDEWVSQYGTQRANGTFKFRNHLREERDPPERSMSVVRGKFEPSEVGASCYKSFTPSARDACRHATVGTLRQMGFVVEHSPRPMSALHVSVYLADGAWDDDIADKFRMSFDPPKGGRDV